MVRLLTKTAITFIFASILGPNASYAQGTIKLDCRMSGMIGQKPFLESPYAWSIVINQRAKTISHKAKSWKGANKYRIVANTPDRIGAIRIEEDTYTDGKSAGLINLSTLWISKRTLKAGLSTNNMTDGRDTPGGSYEWFECVRPIR